MAELAPLERLQPFLLDRLTNDEPERTMESRERRVMSQREYRAAVLRDLGWLLNATAPPEHEGLSAYPEVAKSVLNYGMQALSGLGASSVTPAKVERAVRNAIVAYEPRLVRRSLQVSVVETGETGSADAPYILRIEIHGEIWNLPVPETLYIRTELDLETSQYKLADPTQPV